MRRFTMLLAAAFTVVTAISCNKDDGYTPGFDAAGQIEICITGDFNDFSTKAEIENIFRMTWAEGTGDPKVYDKVYVFGKASGADVFSHLGTLDAVPDANTGNRVADLKGTIAVPQADAKLTLVYSPLLATAPSVSDGAISIDLSSQGGKPDSVVFVAYTTVDYKGATDATYRTSFSFATSVLRVNASGLTTSTALTKATLGKIETNCKLAFATDAAPTVTGDNTDGTITREFTDCSANDKGCAAFYIAVPAITENANRTLTVTQSGNEYGANGFATGSKDAGNMMNSITNLFTTGQRGFLNDQEYVIIKGSDGKYLKWATQNLAVTTSGKAKWNGTNYIIGDYFQWAASYGGYNIAAENQKDTNLVIYSSFTNTCTGGVSNSFTFKTGKQLNEASAPYYKSGTGTSTEYTKYNPTDSKTVLEQSDDVANIVLGGTWRMPTGGSTGELQAMRAVTYWAWDATDIGYYVFKPGLGTSGAAGGKGTFGTGDDKTKALLFFPAALGLSDAGKYSNYWSSTLVNNSTELARFLFSSSEGVDPVHGGEYRYYGLSVRPVSD